VKQSRKIIMLDCFAATAARNDGTVANLPTTRALFGDFLGMFPVRPFSGGGA